MSDKQIEVGDLVHVRLNYRSSRFGFTSFGQLDEWLIVSEVTDNGVKVEFDPDDGLLADLLTGVTINKKEFRNIDIRKRIK